MNFRLRLALLFVTTLVAVQVFTALLAYGVARRALIADGERQLAVGAAAVARQLDDISARVADNVQVLSLDFALRAAIAQDDQSTVLSALRNHGRRIGAERMLLVGLDGTVRSDTAQPAGGAFPFADLADDALDHPAAAVVALDGKAYWMIVVPVYAPKPIALIAAGIPIDDALLARLQQLSTLPNTLELVTAGVHGRWAGIARGDNRVEIAPALAGRALPLQPTLMSLDAREYVVLATRLRESERGAPVAAVLGYSLDDALRPYRSVAIAWASLVALGLAIGLAGSLLIARGVARPIEKLAAAAHRIGAGDYASSTPMVKHDEVGQLAAALSNMTLAIAEREERIRYQAEHDAVTALPNRHAAEAVIRDALAARPTAGALLMIGLARLPEIIQTRGHTISDRLMRDAGARLRPFAARGVVARATDTQFALWLDGADKADAIAVAFRVLDVLGVPYQESDLSIDTAPAIGIALQPQHGDEASTLLRRAEIALFAALGAEDPVAVYDARTDPHRPERLTLMTELREALDHNQLRLHYQPKLRLADERIDGAEALLRWQHPLRGAVPPDTFIPLAERTGNIRRVTRWVLASGIAQAHEWAARGHSVRIAINLSARDLDDADLPTRVADLLSLHGVPPRSIVLELTESAVMGEPDTAVQVLKRLADLGIDLALDDFGVGQSSFAYLRRLPVREIKIDRFFTRKLAEDVGDRTLVRSIVELGHRLGYRVTAEGIETRAAFEYLREVGCDHVQGYYIAPALEADAFEAMLAQGDAANRGARA
ncbi:MAG: putative bifunctional diguanylate cyclase/phosphodiesterase [Dokdonella sp.]|uniref:putative bifunctional diguanylate cyclase/phosphodiesterase n=1 Tax=Dokdonella sp. TaxID=2291710 RepID=UPI003F803BC1